MGVFSPERAYRGNLPPPAPRRTRSPCQEVVRRETGSPDLVFQYREAHQSQTIGAVQFILDKNQQDALHITITTLGYFQVNYPEDTRSGKRAGRGKMFRVAAWWDPVGARPSPAVPTPRRPPLAVSASLLRCSRPHHAPRDAIRYGRLAFLIALLDGLFLRGPCG